MELPINQILNGDCIEHLKEFPENSVDAIITDPPYGLEFMGKEWDKFKKAEYIGGGTMINRNTPFQRGEKTPPAYYIWTNEQKHQMQNFFFEYGKEAIRVLKPGGFLLSFGGTRTYHRLVCGIEDAGFEIRDTIMWIYGSGFPKSLAIGKQIDKIQGNEREIIGKGSGKSLVHQNQVNKEQDFRPNDYYENNEGEFELTKGNTEWEGWGTALKPACEPIVVARKPLSEKNVALNVLKWGTGGINIDECRIETKGEDLSIEREGNKELDTQKQGWGFKAVSRSNEGRFPANIILDEEAGQMLDEQSGELISGNLTQKHKPQIKEKGIYGEFGTDRIRQDYNLNKGGASRFFYCAKASKSERNVGCDKLDDKTTDDGREVVSNRPHQRGATLRKNNHPTVKPIKLMEYLIKLITKKGQIVLDPFLGSGTTAIACEKLGRLWIGIEKEPEYVEISKARIKCYSSQKKL